MVSDIWIEKLEAADGDVAEWAPFPNGWGLSIIRTQPTVVEIPGYPPTMAGGSYGAAAGLFEVALLKHDDVCFDGPLLREPEGWLTPADVVRIMREVFELPPATSSRFPSQGH